VRGGEQDADSKRAALVERIRAREVALKASEEQKFETAITNREKTFVYWLWKLWEEAQWIHTVQQFPDGRPMKEQSQHRRHVWLILISGINRRMWGNESESEEEDLGATAED